MQKYLLMFLVCLKVTFSSANIETLDILLITHYQKETDLTSAAVDIAFEDFMKQPNNFGNYTFK